MPTRHTAARLSERRFFHARLSFSFLCTSTLVIDGPCDRLCFYLPLWQPAQWLVGDSGIFSLHPQQRTSRLWPRGTEMFTLRSPQSLHTLEWSCSRSDRPTHPRHVVISMPLAVSSSFTYTDQYAHSQPTTQNRLKDAIPVPFVSQTPFSKPWAVATPTHQCRTAISLLAASNSPRSLDPLRVIHM